MILKCIHEIDTKSNCNNINLLEGNEICEIEKK